MKDHIIMVGDPVHGFNHIGPFTKEEANAEFERMNSAAPAATAIWIIKLIPQGK